MSDLRVVRLVQRARLLLADGTAVGVNLFVAPDSPRGTGPQTVPELMREAGAVLPVRLEDGRFVLVGTAQVAGVLVPENFPVGPEVGAPVDVRVELAGGHRVSGRVRVEEGVRVTDLLRRPGPWVRVETPEGVVWVHKGHLRSVEPLETAPPLS